MSYMYLMFLVFSIFIGIMGITYIIISKNLHIIFTLPFIFFFIYSLYLGEWFFAIIFFTTIVTLFFALRNTNRW